MHRLASSWSNTLNKLGFRRVHTRSSRPQIVKHRRPSIESLESRHMLSITVNTLVDENDGINTGDVSLRDAIAHAATQTGFDVIEFDPSLSDGVIELSHGQITIDSDLAIVGPGMDSLTIDADGASRTFLVDSGVNATIIGLTITGGAADYGGGVYVLGSLAMDSVRVAGNTASADGGGIFAHGTLSLESSIVNGNDAAANGGGIYVNSTGQAAINGSTLDDNEAYYGGGVYGYLNTGENLVIQNSTLSHNRANGTWASGGGLLINGAASDAVATVVNSTISNNTASYSGAIRIVGGNTEIDLTNSTIAHNRGDESGGIQYSGGPSATLHNTIVAENTNAAGNTKLDVYGTLDTASSYNLIGSGGSGGLVDGTNHNIVLTSLQSAGLLPLGDYGGPTQTHALINDSPALDAGSNSIVELYEIEVDQLNHQRLTDSPVAANNGANFIDIGAFEAGDATILAVKTTDDELDDIYDPEFDWNDLSLRESLAIAKVQAGAEIIDLTGVFGVIWLGEWGELEIVDSVTYHAPTEPPVFEGQEAVDIAEFDHISIVGPGAEYLTITAHGDSRVFHQLPGGSATISGLTVTGGAADLGGGILAEANLTLVQMKIYENEARAGGGVFSGTYVPLFGYQPLGELHIIDSRIESNDAIGPGSLAGWGGGVAAIGYSEIVGTEVLDNHAEDFGGGIWNATDVSNSRIVGNTAAEYGGIYFWEGATITNSTIAYNSATNGAGGIGQGDHTGLYGPFVPSLILNSTIVFNDSGSGDGGGIFGSTDVELVNSIVAENTSGQGTNLYDVSGSLYGSYNLIGSIGTVTSLEDESSFLGSDLDYLHPGLIELSGIGGPANVFILPPDSEAIDAGDDTAATDLVFDQLGDGFQRKLGNAVDIGASEAHVILRGDGTLEVYGTELDDSITVDGDSVTLDGIGEIQVDVASADTIVVDTGGGGDHVNIDEGVSSKLEPPVGLPENPFPDPPWADVEFNYVSGLITPVPLVRVGNEFFSSPRLISLDDGPMDIAAFMDAAWFIDPEKFTQTPWLVDWPRELRVDSLGIIQIVKLTSQADSAQYPELVPPIEALYTHDWEIDTDDEGLWYPYKGEAYPGSYSSVSFGATGAVLSLQDAPNDLPPNSVPVVMRVRFG